MRFFPAIGLIGLGLLIDSSALHAQAAFLQPPAVSPIPGIVIAPSQVYVARPAYASPWASSTFPGQVYAGEISAFRPSLTPPTYAPSPAYRAMRPITGQAVVGLSQVTSFYAPSAPLTVAPTLPAPVPLVPVTGVVVGPRYVPGQPIRNAVRAFAP